MLRVFEDLTFKQITLFNLTPIEVIRSMVTQEKRETDLGLEKRRIEKETYFFGQIVSRVAINLKTYTLK